MNVDNRFVLLATLGMLVAFALGALSQHPPGGSRVPNATPSPASLAVAGASPTSQESARGASVQWAFTQAGDHPDVHLADGINAAQREVDAAGYAINRAADVDALAAAQARCGCVRLLSDAEQSRGSAQSAALQRLQAAGVPIKINSHTGIMHLKLLETDREVVYVGSFNWTNAASTVNDEVLVRIASSELATATAAEFDQMWGDGRRFKDWQPVAPAPSPGLPQF